MFGSAAQFDALPRSTKPVGHISCNLFGLLSFRSGARAPEQDWDTLLLAGTLAREEGKSEQRKHLQAFRHAIRETGKSACFHGVPPSMDLIAGRACIML